MSQQRARLAVLGAILLGLAPRAARATQKFGPIQVSGNLQTANIVRTPDQNAEGVSRHGRFRIRPEAGTEYQEAAQKSANFLFDEIGPRLAQGPIRLGVFVQMAERGDDVADASVPWPDNRAQIPFGTLTLIARVDDQEPERRRIIFDPVPRVDGIDTSGDPLTEVRSDIYLLSGRRRRAASEE